MAQQYDKFKDTAGFAGIIAGDDGALGIKVHARHAAATGSSGIARGLLRNSIAFLKRANLAAPSRTRGDV